MWRPLGNKPPTVREGEQTSSSGSSSSSTSSSSETSSDDEYDIAKVLRDLPERKERSAEISEFFAHEGMKLRYDRELYQINAEIKQRKMALQEQAKADKQAGDDSSSDSEVIKDRKAAKVASKQTFECKQRVRSRSKSKSKKN